MAAAFDVKSRDVLSEREVRTLATFVAVLKHHDVENHEQDLAETRLFLDALTMSGWAVLPQGAVDNMVRILLGTRMEHTG